MRPSALKSRAAEVGVERRMLEEADDADKPSIALTELIMEIEHLRMEAETRTNTARWSVGSEARLDESGASLSLGSNQEELLGQIIDQDRSYGLNTDLSEAQQRQKILREMAAGRDAMAARNAQLGNVWVALSQLRPSALRRRLKEARIDESGLDGVNDAETLKRALIDLVMDQRA